MLALGAYKETIAEDPKYSIFGFKEEEKEFTEIENTFCLSFDSLLKPKQNEGSLAKGNNSDMRNKEFSRMDMLQPPIPGLAKTIKNNIYRIGYLALSMGVFIGIGNLSSKYC